MTEIRVQELEPVQPLTKDEVFRIEALGAAATYLATRSSPHSPLDYAEHFRHWLKTGEDTLTVPNPSGRQ